MRRPEGNNTLGNRVLTTGLEFPQELGPFLYNLPISSRRIGRGWSVLQEVVKRKQPEANKQTLSLQRFRQLMAAAPTSAAGRAHTLTFLNRSH